MIKKLLHRLKCFLGLHNLKYLGGYKAAKGSNDFNIKVKRTECKDCKKIISEESCN